MTTADELGEDLPTQAVVHAVQRTPRDTAEILAGIPAEVLQRNLAPVAQMVAQMQQSSMMRIAAEMQRITAPMAALPPRWSGRPRPYIR